MTEQEQDSQPVATVTLYRLEPAADSPKPKGGGGSDDADSGIGTRLILSREEAEASRAGAVQEYGKLVEVEVGSCDLCLSGEVTIGRKGKCDLRPLQNDKTLDVTVSGVHCVILVGGAEEGCPVVQVTDRSSNSTFINGMTRIRREESRPFTEDAFLSLGRNIFKPDYNGPPRGFRVRYELTPYGLAAGVNRRA